MSRYLRLVLFVLIALGPDALWAQDGLPPCWPPPCIPIDGGLTALLAAGALLGGRKLLSGKRPN